MKLDRCLTKLVAIEILGKTGFQRDFPILSSFFKTIMLFYLFLTSKYLKNREKIKVYLQGEDKGGLHLSSAYQL